MRISFTFFEVIFVGGCYFIHKKGSDFCGKQNFFIHKKGTVFCGNHWNELFLVVGLNCFLWYIGTDFCGRFELFFVASYIIGIIKSITE